MKTRFVVRRAAIKRFRRRIHGEDKFVHVWNEVGGTQGLLTLFAELSVNDVRLFCRILGRSSTWVSGRDVRQIYMTELVESLASDHFADAKFKNPENRPLLKYYGNVVPACTADLVHKWIKNDDLPDVDLYRRYQAHAEYYREECLQRLKADNEKFKFSEYELLLHELPRAAATKRLSQSMAFSLELLKTLERNSEIKLGATQILDGLAYPLLRRLERRKSTGDLRAEVIQSVRYCLEARPGSAEHLSLGRCGLLGYTIRIWTRGPRQIRRCPRVRLEVDTKVSVVLFS